jgi:hypothetical protein
MSFVKEILKLPIPRKTFLEVLEVHDKEVPMANLLAYFFNPNNKHGLENLFIRSLLKTKYYDLDIKKYPNSKSTLIAQSTKLIDKQNEILNGICDVTVETEVKTKLASDSDNQSQIDDQKRIDILIETKYFVICIEFKINHNLDNPLNTYQSYIEAKYKNKEKQLFFIVLTPYKKEPIDKIKNNKLFKQVIIRHFIDNVIAEIPEKCQKDNFHSQYFCDFLQTIDNRSIDYKIKKIIENFSYTIEAAPFIEVLDDVSEFWSNRLTKIKIENLAKQNRGFNYNKNSKGGFIEINKTCFALKIRIENNKWQIERWSLENKKEKILFVCDYSILYINLIKQISDYITYKSQHQVNILNN